MPSLEAFQYEVLPVDGKSIRLVRVLPSTGFDRPVRIELINSTTEDEYTALSYTWGAPDPRRDIEINHALLTVGPNLWEFLKRVSLSPEYVGKKFWIDAICINQKDAQEKSVQVARMGEIYKSAHHVLIWLAPFRDASLALEDSVGPICDFREVVTCLPREEREQLGSDLPKFRTCSTLIFVRSVCEQIVSHDYWRRLWIVQEFLLNEKRSVLYGPLAISWKVLSAYEDFRTASRRERQRKIWQNTLLDWIRSPFDMLTFLMSRSDTLAKFIDVERTDAAAHYGVSLPGPGIAYTASSVLLTLISWMDKLTPSVLAGIVSWRLDSLYTCLPYMEGTFRDHNHDRRPMQATSKSVFYLLVQSFAEQLCFDRKDKLYGLSALVSQTCPVHIDYTIDIYELYYRALHFFLNMQNSSVEYCWMAPDLVASGLLDAFKISLSQISFRDAKRRGSNFYLASEAEAEIGCSDASTSVTMTKTIVSNFMTFQDCAKAYIDVEQKITLHCKKCAMDNVFSASALVKILEIQQAGSRLIHKQEKEDLVMVLLCLAQGHDDAESDQKSNKVSSSLLAKHLLFYSNPQSGNPEAILSVADEASRQQMIRNMPPNELKAVLEYLKQLGRSHSASRTLVTDAPT